MSALQPKFALPAPERSVPGPAIDATERFARLRLARSGNVGPRTYAHLMRRFGTALRALAALPELAERGGRPGYKPCPVDEAEREMAAAEGAGARLLLLGDPDYPRLLAAVEPAPPALWMQGDPGVFGRSAVAVVGARNASALGLRTARRLARELAANGHVIVSGMARGVDSAAHEASLSTGTVAVLAGGLDHPYPPENADLARQIAGSGAVVTEAPFGTVATASHFPRRNRLISGLAQGVVLIEAAARSGSLITARFALEQGREAMACPGAPEDPRSAGCNALIREGAALIRHAGDVEEALAAPRTLHLREPGREFEFDLELFEDEPPPDDFDALGEFDADDGRDRVLPERIVELLGPSAVDVDELARHCRATTAELSLALLELELAGRIELRPGGAVALAALAD